METIDGRFPCASIDDIIASKKGAKRQRDKEELPRLEAFRDELKRRKKKIHKNTIGRRKKNA